MCYTYHVYCYVELLNKLDLVPWKSFSEVPATRKYGMDEVGTDTTKRMGKIFVSTELLGPLFQITPEGNNKMNHHITLCITTRADGKYCREDFHLEGVCGQMVIHDGGTRNKDEDCNAAVSLDENFRFDPKYLSRLGNLDANPNDPKESHQRKPMNFNVRVTPDGSMDKQRFLDWCHHFVTNLPSTQGKGKETVFLQLNGHVSRSNLTAMRYLKANTVFAFFLPSQPHLDLEPAK
eukprot:scaffold10743_cov58-Attheya_sp.AAC.4